MSEHADSQDEVRLGYRRCTSCEREHPMDFLEDGVCPQCRQEEPEPMSAERRREERRALFVSTAKALRKIGRPDRAEWYEQQIAALDTEAMGGAA